MRQLNKNSVIIVSFYSIATIPLLKPNISSISVIVFILLNLLFSSFKRNNNLAIQKKYVVLSIPFLLFFLYELLSKSYNLKIILLNLPFLIFPLVFLYKPKYINPKVIDNTIKIFQISVLVQCFIYLIVFLKKNNIRELLNISKENIPFFREYVTSNYLIEMHPTYFSSFLLFSITFSLFKFKSNIVFNLLNLIISLFFIMLFSSRIILLILLLTLTIYLSVQISKSRKKVIKFFGLFLVITVIFIFNTDVVKNRFKEVMSQFDKPISGNYYNSTNTRIAIYKCNIQLTKELPFFGYGNALQNKLDDCYAKNYDSIFYKVNIFNTHNYYFYILLYGGWFFLILFLVCFYYIFTTLKNNMMHVVFFFQVLMINLTENYLSRHYGLFLFCFFITIFIYVNLNERNPEFREI